MKRLFVAFSLFGAIAFLETRQAKADDFGQATLKGISSIQVGSVTFDQEALTRLTMTQNQLKATIQSYLSQNTPAGLTIANGQVDPTITTWIRLAPVRNPVGRGPIIFWIYRIDVAVTQTVSIARASKNIQATIPTWRMIAGGIVDKDFDANLKGVIIQSQLPQLLQDWKTVNP